MEARVLVVDDSATLRRILSRVLGEAGYEVATAADGAEALDRVQREPFDLALVDFVMPRLNGFQFAQAVRSIASLRALRVVLVSARADAIAERFVASTGAVGWLAKPFTPRALLACVAEGLARTSGPGPAEESPLTPGEARALLETADAAGEPVVYLERPKARRAAEPRESGVQERPARGDPGLRAAAAAVRAHVEAGGSLDDDALAAVLRPASEAAALEGRIERVPLGEVFQLLALQAQRGMLEIESDDPDLHPGAGVRVALRDGRIDLCLGSRLGDEFLLGRYVSGLGMASREVVERAASVADGALLGERLLRAGEITRVDLARALTRQSCEVLYEVLRWRRGRFRFFAGDAPRAASAAALGLASDTLVMEGFRRVDEWHVIRDAVPSERAVLVRDDAGLLHASQRLDPDEQSVLRAVDGRRTVREVVRELSMSSFDVCKILCRLVRARVLVAVAA